MAIQGVRTKGWLVRLRGMDCFVAALLAMTENGAMAQFLFVIAQAAYFLRHREGRRPVAIQGVRTKGWLVRLRDMDCFVADAPRNDGKRSGRGTFIVIARAVRPVAIQGVRTKGWLVRLRGMDCFVAALLAMTGKEASSQ